MTPEQVLVVIGRLARLGFDSRMAGTIFAADSITASPDSITEGALIGGDTIKVGRNAVVKLRAFAGW